MVRSVTPLTLVMCRLRSRRWWRQCWTVIMVGDEADLMAAVKGATPTEVRAAALRFVELNQRDGHVLPGRDEELRAGRYSGVPGQF